MRKLTHYRLPFDAAKLGHTAGRSLVICCLTAADTAPVLARTFQAVQVRGAEFIPEEDIRLTCGALPGVDYLDIELVAIEDCLMTTGVFERVKLIPEDDTLVIDVVEIDNRPGRIEGTLSYVSQDGITAEVMLEQYNLFPKTYGALNLSYNAQVKMIEANLYRADAFSDDLDLGLTILAYENDYDERSFSEESISIEPYLAWTPNDRLRVEGALGLRDYKLFDVEPTASPLLLQEQTDGILGPYLRLSVSYGTAQSPRQTDAIDMSALYSIRLDQTFWNLGTSDPLSDTRLAMTGELPMTSDLSLIASVAAGSVMGLDGNDTRSIDRYYPGADTFRGFAPRGIGPRDGDDVLGGNHYLVGSLELQRDLQSLIDLPISAGIFVESGAAWGLDDTLNGRIDDSWRTRTSVGLSVSFEVGQTPVSIYLARPVQREPGDESQTFGIKFTALF